MTTSKSIEETIKDEAEKLYPDKQRYSMSHLKREAYIAGRSQNLAMEREYRQTLEELVRLKSIKDELDEVEPDKQDQAFVNRYAQYRIDKFKAWQQAKQLLKP